MARFFDGANDEIVFGSDAAIDNFTQLSISIRVKRDVVDAIQFIAGKSIQSAVFGLSLENNAGSNRPTFKYQFSTTQGIWTGGTALSSTSAFYHIVVTYDNTNVANDPSFYLDGNPLSLTVDTNPTGTPNADAAASLRIGEDSGGGLDFDGNLGWFVYHNTIFAAEEVNRARWWGRPFGGLKVYHPMMTGKLTNEGTATATGVAVGTGVIAMPCPVVRPGSAMMGMGIGW